MATVIALAAAALIIIVDQVIKYFVYAGLSPNGRVTVIENLFSLIYSENRGAAFGVFQDGTLFFIIVTSALIGVFFYLLIHKKFSGKLFYTSVALILGGGIGNLIDRIFRGFVIDYLSVSFFPPICNFADYCITIGAVLFMICIIISPELSKKQKDDSDGEKADE